MTAFQRLVRFIAKDGKTYMGDAILPRGVDDAGKATHAHVIHGNVFGEHRVTNDRLEIQQLLCPLPRDAVRTVRCLGLNYGQHARELNNPLPQHPVIFYKPLPALSGPFDPIPVSRMAQRTPAVDYECELVVVIGKEAKNVSQAEALGCVFGYCVGNDVSQRDWQLKLGGGQWSLGKMFDGWAPIGPAIIHPSLLPDPQAVRLATWVNGTQVQDASTADMIFGVAETISFLSQGCTLLPGDLIFTGTPQGVGSGRTPPLWLKHGDQVEVWMEQCGTISNKVVFQTPHDAKL